MLAGRESVILTGTLATDANLGTPPPVSMQMPKQSCERAKHTPLSPGFQAFQVDG